VTDRQRLRDHPTEGQPEDDGRLKSEFAKIAGDVSRVIRERVVGGGKGRPAVSREIDAHDRETGTQPRDDGIPTG
jgi:hypothetical protein